MASRPAKPSETIILYGTGFGAVSPSILPGRIVTQINQLAQPIRVFFGSVQAQLTYSGLAPNFVGVYQFNVVVPDMPDSDTVPLRFELGGTAGTQTLVTCVRR